MLTLALILLVSYAAGRSRYGYLTYDGALSAAWAAIAVLWTVVIVLGLL